MLQNKSQRFASGAVQCRQHSLSGPRYQSSCNVAESSGLYGDLRRRALEIEVAARMEERELLAAELHDGVNQVLAATNLLLTLALSKPEDAPALVLESIENIKTAITEIRQIAAGEFSSPFHNRSFSEAICQLFEPLKKAKTTRVVVRISKNAEALLTNEQMLQLYRILQEQNTNIIRYADASRVLVTLELKGGLFTLVTRDNGAGFDLHASSRKGTGLATLDLRVGQLKGQYVISSQPGKGTCIKISFPLHTSGNTSS